MGQRRCFFYAQDARFLGRRLRGFWGVSVVGGGRVVFFYAQDAAAEVEERSAGGGCAVLGCECCRWWLSGSATGSACLSGNKGRRLLMGKLPC